MDMMNIWINKWLNFTKYIRTHRELISTSTIPTFWTEHEIQKALPITNHYPTCTTSLNDLDCTFTPVKTRTKRERENIRKQKEKKKKSQFIVWQYFGGVCTSVSLSFCVFEEETRVRTYLNVFMYGYSCLWSKQGFGSFKLCLNLPVSLFLFVITFSPSPSSS